jgi:flagellin-like protein
LFKLLSSRKAISPILATLMLIVIAVASVVVSYAWIMTFTSTQTQQAGVILVVENVRFYGTPLATDKNKTDITIRNTGTAASKIASVYWSSSSFSSLVKLTITTDYSMDPVSGVVNPLSSIKTTINWESSGTTGDSWTSGTTYYFKIVSETGQNLEFTSRAP